MSALVAATTVLAAVPAWSPDVRAAERYVQSRPGTVSFSVRTPCGVWGRRQDRAVQSASVIKAMFLVAYLNRPGVRRRAPTRAERRLLSRMIRRSDDAAANRIATLVGAPALERAARSWEMSGFRLADPWGASLITARRQSRFWLRIDRYVPKRHRAYALKLLRTVVPSQRWGIGRGVPRGWTLQFKGGWGSGRGLVDHQAALLTRDGQRVSVAILTTAQGSHAAGKATLRGVARKLLRGLAATRYICVRK